MELILAGEIVVGDIIETSDGAERVLHVTQDPRGVLSIEVFSEGHTWHGVMKDEKVVRYERVEGEKELQRLGRA